MDATTKMVCTVNALYGVGVARQLPKKLSFKYSKTGRIRGVYHQDKLYCILRPDGGLAISIPMAQDLLRSRRFRESCVEVDEESAPFVAEGRSVFAGHIVRCGRSVRAGTDTAVLYKNSVIAVGRAVIPAEIMAGCTRGVAIKIRKGLKGRQRNDKP